jgi:hypothetical protein
LSIVVTAGQRGDSPQWIPVLRGIRVPRPASGRPRTRPDRVLVDKASTSKVNRECRRHRGITATIPSKVDQDAHRQAKGLERHRAAATRHDKRAVRYEATFHVAAINEWL